MVPGTIVATHRPRSTQHREQPRPYHGRLARAGWADNRDERRARRRLDEPSRRGLPTEELGGVGLAERVQPLVGVHALLLERDERAARVGPGPVTPGADTLEARRHAPCRRGGGGPPGETSSPMSPKRSEGSGPVAVRRTRSTPTGRSRGSRGRSGWARRLSCGAGTQASRSRRVGGRRRAPTGARRTRRCRRDRRVLTPSCSGAAYTGEPAERNASSVRLPPRKRDPEVAEVRVADLVVHDVRRLHVTVHDPRRVRDGERGADLLDQLRQLASVNGPCRTSRSSADPPRR